MDNTVYKVVGRYMSGAEVEAYHLESIDGKRSVKAKKSIVIMLAARKQIVNMRVQYSGEDVIIRGNGINLNKLPVYDLNKEAMRNKNNTNINKNGPISQYRITKRIMYQNKCVGYEVTSSKDESANVNRSKAIELATAGRIANAEAQRYNGPDGMPRVILRGVQCDLKSLPMVYVDVNGNIITKESENNKVNVRVVQVKKPGILYNDREKQRKMFEANDFIVCTPNGKLNILKRESAVGKLTPLNRDIEVKAAGDNNLANIGDFSIEFLGEQKRQMTASIIYKWIVCRIVK